MWNKENFLVVIPLTIFACIVFGFALYNTACKNSLLDFLHC